MDPPLQRVKKVLFIQKTASHTVGAYKSAARPFCVQNGIANGDNYLFSSKIPTIAAQLLGGRQIAAPTASQQDFRFFDRLGAVANYSLQQPFVCGFRFTLLFLRKMYQRGFQRGKRR